MSKKTTILAVDDDPILMDSVADILRNAGYRPLTASNGINALRMMQEEVPDLIVADIMMPEMNGYQFCKAVRENVAWRAIPFIFLTARSEQDDIRRGYRFGADHYLTKPFEPDDLLLVIETRLKRLTDIRETTREEIESTTNKLLAIFGDELRSPLSFIYDFISLLRESRQSLGSGTTDEILIQMKDGVDELVQRIEDLMTIVYIDSGATALEIEERCQSVALSSIIQSAMRNLSPFAEQRGIAISLLVPIDLNVFGVPDYVQDIYRRVIEYAIKTARPADGHVWVKVELQADQAVAMISNDGLEVDTSSIARLFAPLADIDQQAISEQRISLGLVIAERLTRLHRGSIYVESTAGQGTTLTLALPATD